MSKTKARLTTDVAHHVTAASFSGKSFWVITRTLSCQFLGSFVICHRHLFVVLKDFAIDHVQGSLEDRITEEAYEELVRKRNKALQSIPTRHSTALSH